MRLLVERGHHHDLFFNNAAPNCLTAVPYESKTLCFSVFGQELALNINRHYRITMPVAINVQDYGALFEHIKQPHLNSDIGSYMLDEQEMPINWIELAVHSDGQSYNLEARLDYHGDVGDVLDNIGRALEGKYFFGQNFDNGFIVNSPSSLKLSSGRRLMRFVFGMEYDIEILNMHSAIWVLAGGGLLPVTDARRISTQEGFRADFDFFKDVTETAINAIYRNFGAGQVPDYAVTVRISPPEKEEVSEKKGEEGEEKRESLDRLVSRMLGVSAERFQTLSVEKPEIDFNQIIGNERAKEELRAIADGVKDPASYAKWGTDLPKGVLLYGPPGTAKTTLARATAYNAAAAFYAPRLSELLSKWYSESEQRVQNLFDQAKKTAPSIIFLDEIDVIGGRRDAAHEASERVLSVILTNMEGLVPANGVVVIGATNRPHVLDEALTRPGRLDYLIEVYLPTPAELAQIFIVHQKLAEERARRQLFEPSIDYSEAAKQLSGASGADAREIIRRALQEQARAERRGEKAGLVGLEQVLGVVKAYERKPSVYERPRRLGFHTPNMDK